MLSHILPSLFSQFSFSSFSISPLPFSSPLTDPPVITARLPYNLNITLKSGAPQTITVRYDQGYPSNATVEWSKDGNPILDPPITTANGETKLTLTNNDPSVGGTYVVKVSNGVGNDATAVWTVKAECKLL